MKIILDTDLEQKIKELVQGGMSYIEALVHISDERGFGIIDLAHWAKKHPAIIAQLEQEGFEDGTLKRENTIQSALNAAQ